MFWTGKYSVLPTALAVCSGNVSFAEFGGITIIGCLVRTSSMTDAEIQAEIAKQIRDKLAALTTKLRETAQHNGPPIRKTLI